MATGFNQATGVLTLDVEAATFSGGTLTLTVGQAEQYAFGGGLRILGINPPGAPELTAIPSRTEDFTFDLSWTEVPDATSYEAQVRVGATGSPTAIPGISGRTHTFTGLEGQDLSFRVRALKGTVPGAWSPWSSSLDTLYLGRIRNLAIAYSNRTFSFSWDAVATATGYEYRANWSWFRLIGREYQRRTGSRSGSGTETSVRLPQISSRGFGTASPTPSLVVSVRALRSGRTPGEWFYARYGTLDDGEAGSEEIGSATDILGEGGEGPGTGPAPGGGRERGPSLSDTIAGLVSGERSIADIPADQRSAVADLARGLGQNLSERFSGIPGQVGRAVGQAISNIADQIDDSDDDNEEGGSGGGGGGSDCGDSCGGTPSCSCAPGGGSCALG